MKNRSDLRKLKREILNDLEVGSVHIAKKKINSISDKKQGLKEFLNSINVERISGVGTREQSTNRFKSIKWGKSPKNTQKKRYKRNNKKTKKRNDKTRKKTKQRKRK
jgi:hypothetical protein